MSKQALSVRLLSLKLHETSQEIEKFFFIFFIQKKTKGIMGINSGSWDHAQKLRIKQKDWII